MKILLYNTYYTPNIVGGADRVTQALAEGLNRAGHEVVVATLSKDNQFRVQHLNGVKIYYLPVNNRLSHLRVPNRNFLTRILWHFWSAFNPAGKKAIRALIDQEKPDLVHTHSLAGFTVATWRIANKAKLPVVHTLHDHYLACPRGTMFVNGSNCRLQCAACRIVTGMRRAHCDYLDAVIGVSDYIINRHLELGYFNNTAMRKVIRNSTDKIDAHEARVEYDGPIRLGFLGRLAPFKGLELLLSTLASIQSGSWKLNIAGSGSSDYVKYLKDNWPCKNVEHLGFVKPQTLFRNIDVLVVPSTYNDPAPLVILEAYAHGIPVLVSNYGGSPEMVIEGETGWVFDPDDNRSLKHKLEDLTKNPLPWIDIRQKCLQMAENYTLERMVDKYVNIYQRSLTRD